jgi:transcription elongation factor GreB
LYHQEQTLPEGVVNYVTQGGMGELWMKNKNWLAKRESEIDENERRLALNYINAKLQLLNNRIATAKIVDLNNQPNDEIRFGALVF